MFNLEKTVRDMAALFKDIKVRPVFHHHKTEDLLIKNGLTVDA